MKTNTLLKQKLGYACGDIYGGGAFLIFSMLYMGYLILVEGLTPVQTTTIMFIGKLWDAVTDPLMGVISDRTRSRFGRRRVYYLFGSVFVLVSFIMLWYSFGINETNRLLLYHTFAYMLFGTAFTVVMVPYNAILSDMTDDYDERTNYTGMRMVFSAATAIVCAVFPSMLISRFGSSVIGEAQKPGYLAMGIAFGLLFALGWIFAFLGTKEKPELMQKTQGSSFRDWAVVFQNKTYRTYLGIFLTVQIAIDLLLALIIFYVDIVLLKSESYIIIVGVLSVFQLIFMVVANKIAQKKGKHFPLLLGMPVWILVSFSFLFFSPTTPIFLVCIVAAVVGFGAACGNLSTWSLLSDSFDVDELMTGKRHEGLYSGFTTFMRKAASGAAILLLGFGLELAGFNQNEYTLLKTIDSATGTFDASMYATSGVVTAIKYMFVLVPVVLLTLTVIFTLRYKLNKRRFALVLSAIARFQADGDQATFTAEEATDLKLVTGRSVERLWGRGKRKAK